MQKTLQARSTNSERLLSAASHVSNEKRKRWLMLVTVWWLKSRNGLKWLVNKLQNVMFSNTSTDCMYSNSAAWARGARVQDQSARKICAKTLLLVIVRVLLCVSSVPASCVNIWFVSCPRFMSLWVKYVPAVCMWLCVNYPVYLVPVFWVWFRLVYSLLPGVSVSLPCLVLPWCLD